MTNNLAYDLCSHQLLNYIHIYLYGLALSMKSFKELSENLIR